MQSQKGMWRRVDELGRVVIPKEIRIYLNVKSGDIIEFCSQDSAVLLRKYHRLNDIKEIANICAYACNNIQDAIISIASSDQIVASTNKSLLNRSIDSKNSNYLTDSDEGIVDILSNKTLHTFPITANGDQHGIILLHTAKHTKDTNIAIAQILTGLLSKYLER